MKLTTNSLPKKINTIHYLLILGLILCINLPIYAQSECDGSLPENISFENVPTLCQQYSNLDFDYTIGVGSPLNYNTSSQVGNIPIGAQY